MFYQTSNSQLDHWLTKFYFWFFPSIYHGNSTKTRRATFLGIVLPATLLALLIQIVSRIIETHSFPLEVILNLIGCAVCLALVYFIHHGQIEWSGFILLGAGLIYTTIAHSQSETLLDPASASYVFIIIAAGILFERIGIVLATLSSGLSLAGLLIVRNNYPGLSGNYWGVTIWTLYSALPLIIGGITFWTILVVWRTFARIDHQMAELAASPESIVITDPEGKVEYVNPKFVQAMGYTLDEARELKLPFFQPDKMPPQTYSKLWATLLAGKVWHGEFQNQTKSGDSFFASYSITPIINAAEKIINFVFTFKDISERKRIEAERIALNRTQELATLYEITHDLGSFTDVVVLCDTILLRLSTFLNLYGGAIYLLETKPGTFTLISEFGMALHLGREIPAIRLSGASAPQFYTGSPPVVRVPINYANECLGILVISIGLSGKPRTEFPNLNLLVLMASQIASAIHNLQMIEQIRAGRARAIVLAKEIINAQEKERRSISRELHDEFGQALTSVQLGLQNLSNLTDPEAHSTLDQLMRIVEHVLEQMRNLSRGLRPSVLDDFGLVPALEWLVEHQINCRGLQTEIIAHDVDARYSEEAETVAFRVAQEAITNVVRHAQATRLTIEVNLVDEMLGLKITDNGVGFELSTAMHNASQGRNLGLLNIHERIELIGGHLQVQTAPHQGTCIHVQIPINTTTFHVERRSTQRSST